MILVEARSVNFLACIRIVDTSFVYIITLFFGTYASNVQARTAQYFWGGSEEC